MLSLRGVWGAKPPAKKGGSGGIPPEKSAGESETKSTSPKGAVKRSER